jgi:hypothetical protein
LTPMFWPSQPPMPSLRPICCWPRGVWMCFPDFVLMCLCVCVCARVAADTGACAGSAGSDGPGLPLAADEPVSRVCTCKARHAGAAGPQPYNVDQGEAAIGWRWRCWTGGWCVLLQQCPCPAVQPLGPDSTLSFSNPAVVYGQQLVCRQEPVGLRVITSAGSVQVPVIRTPAGACMGLCCAV